MQTIKKNLMKCDEIRKHINKDKTNIRSVKECNEILQTIENKKRMHKASNEIIWNITIFQQQNTTYKKQGIS